MAQSEDISEWSKAMVAAAAELHDIGKDAANPHLRVKYATLEAVLAHVRPTLARHGLVLVQDVEGCMAIGDEISVTTTIVHTSGQWRNSVLRAKVEQMRGISIAQSAGQVTTYARRYAAMAACGITATDEDTDAQPQPEKRQQQRPAPKPQPPEKPTRTYADVLDGLQPAAAKWDSDTQRKFCAYVGKLGCDYNDVAAWCESRGWPRPSGMPEEGRQVLAKWLTEMGAEKRKHLVVTP